MQARVAQDTYNEMMRYCEDRDVSQADAIRRALNEKYGDQSKEGFREVAHQSHAWEGLKIVLTAAAAFVGAGAVI